MEDNKERLREKIREFPPTPGVYIMKDRSKKIIYVGKAVNLKNRVYSYFAGRKEGKTAFLVSRVHEIETILTETEYEALVLENNLIKKWKPRYNIRLKDGKTYPVIRISREKYPRAFRTRTLINDKSRYFGPFSDVGAADNYMNLIQKLFPIRRCASMRGRKEPCLYYHMKRCSAPCVGKISPEDYAVHIRKIASLLSGKTKQLLEELNREMKQASKDLAFERAAELRDGIKSIEVLNSGQSVQDFDQQRRDYFTLESSG
ncbi:MAG: excinuclease ABC subunit UvrC [Spirochaetaceae bacterium]|jgi:excinuclease ABC subunit C|nr:excinuclease ABC subunit UvrC [Spirochaetaceae bacterium]